MSTVHDQLHETLARSGRRLTGPRMAVWQALMDGHGHLTVEEIADRVRNLDPSVNLSSVYRSLALFAELGLARETHLGPNEPTEWEVAHPDEQFHLRCTDCGRVEHHTGDVVAQIDDHLARRHGFHADRIEVSVSGKCAACSR